MTWAIDLDEVVFNFVDPYFEFLSKKYGKRIAREDLIDNYSAEKCGLIPIGSTIGNLLEFGALGGFRKLKYMPGALEGLDELTDKFPIIFITSRQKDFRQDTIDSLQALGYGGIPLYFSDDHFSPKGMIITALGINYLVDDHPENINNTRALAPSCITILMSKIPGAIREAHAHEVVSGWEEMKQKRPELQ